MRIRSCCALCCPRLLSSHLWVFGRGGERFKTSDSFILALVGICDGRILAGITPVPSPAPTITWEIATVDWPYHFTRRRDRTLRINPAGQLHLAFGGDALYYAYAEAAGWRIEVVDDNAGVGEYAARALDHAN